MGTEDSENRKPATTWYYYDETGQRQGPVSGGKLKGLAKAGRITPGTMVESESGKVVPAVKIKGLSFVSREPPETIQSTLPKIPVPEIERTIETDKDDVRKSHIIEELSHCDHDRLQAAVLLSSVAILLSIIAHFIVIIGGNIAPESFVMSIISLTAMAGTIIFSIVCMVRLAKLMHYGVVSIVLLAICLPIPLLYFIPLYLVYIRAAKILDPNYGQAPVPVVSNTAQGGKQSFRDANDLSSDLRFGHVVCPNCQTSLEYIKNPSPECIVSVSDKFFVWGCVAWIFFFPLAIILWILSAVTSGGKRDLFQILQCNECGHHFRSHWRGKV